MKRRFFGLDNLSDRERSQLKKFLTYNWVCPPLFLMNYCSILLIQSIGKVSKLPTNSKKSGNGGKQNQKKVCRVKNSLNWKSREKVFDKPYNSVCPPLFLMNYCSIHLIQSIGKVSKLTTNSKKSGNKANKNQKKVCRVKNSLTCLQRSFFFSESNVLKRKEIEVKSVELRRK